jgi:hypothetical protein
MLCYVFVVVIALHGLIHLMGFAKAFDYAELKQLTAPVSKTVGVLWLLTALLLLITALLFLLKKDSWWIIAIPAVLLSQTVIVLSWGDAKFGTIANVILLIAAILGWGSWHFENAYRSDVRENLQQHFSANTDVVTEQDIARLPQPVQRYMRYAGVVNMPRVRNMRVVFEGQMRDRKKAYFPFTSEQYNFFEEPTRLFFMKATLYGVTVPGYHRYRKATASMDIRLFGLFPIIKASGPAMNKTETVTLFNDMCLMAPATLIDLRIQWQLLDDKSAKAIFTNHGISVSATLFFDHEGRLVDFISEDRTDVADMKQYHWSTPVSAYEKNNGYNLLSEGDAVWHYPDGDFTYGKFHVKAISYNINK